MTSISQGGFQIRTSSLLMGVSIEGKAIRAIDIIPAILAIYRRNYLISTVCVLLCI